MGYRDEYYDDDRDHMEREDDYEPLSELEEAVHEQNMFEDEDGNLFPLDDLEDEIEESDIPEELLEDEEEDGAEWE